MKRKVVKKKAAKKKAVRQRKLPPPPKPTEQIQTELKVFLNWLRGPFYRYPMSPEVVRFNPIACMKPRTRDWFMRVPMENMTMTMFGHEGETSLRLRTPESDGEWFDEHPATLAEILEWLESLRDTISQICVAHMNESWTRLRFVDIETLIGLGQIRAGNYPTEYREAVIRACEGLKAFWNKCFCQV